MSIILATGGLGFIGSHTCLEMLNNGFDVLIIDSLINSFSEVKERIEKALINNNDREKGKLYFRKGDIRNYEFLNSIFEEFRSSQKPIKAVIHFAGLKSIYDSIINPLDYWEFNVNGTINLLKVMKKNKCFNIVFSSSASIYKSDSMFPIKEDYELKPINVYSNTKLIIERILDDIYNSESNKWRIVRLRYFNPAGAHSDGFLGEDPKNIATNLFPSIIRTLENKSEFLPIYGNDWPTKDGTCVRDYIHIMDLAEAHLLSLKLILENKPQNLYMNIGTGEGSSILEVLDAFKNYLNLEVKYKFVDRREGDYPYVVADNKLASSILKWKPKRNIVDICKDAWNWQLIKNNKKSK